MPPKRARATPSGDKSGGGTDSSLLSSSNKKKPPPPSKRIVKIADDADEVLAQCRKLRDSLRKKAAAAAAATGGSNKRNYNDDNDSDDDWALDDIVNKASKVKKVSTAAAAAGSKTGTAYDKAKAKTRQMSLAELQKSSSSTEGGKSFLEVVEMNSTEVMEGIENVAVKIAHQVLAKQGFQLDIPSRAASNQIYVPELDRIVLGEKRGTRSFLNVKESRKAAITTRVLQLLHAVLIKRIHITKRDLFYTDVKLFVDQSESDGVLDDVATMIGCTRSNLHVVASDKGLVVGRISFYEDGDFIDCTKMGVGGKAIPPYIDKIENIESDAEFILLVEKEAAYMRMAEDRFYQRYPCIVITAKGQPDVATRMFLSRITAELQIPVLA